MNQKIYCPQAAWACLACRLLIAALAICGVSAAAATSSVDRAQTVVHMLDYVGVDYPEFVKDGKVLNQEEYAEQREFASQSIDLLEQLPAVAEKPLLIGKARQLLARIEAKAPGPEVSGLATAVRADIIRLYDLPVAPRKAPDLRQAATVFQSACAVCHGMQGRGDGPASKGMEPPPSNFHDEERMKVRSIYGLYNTITLGVAGTAMQAAKLAESDRWALAFFVSALRTQPDLIRKGEALWAKKEGKAELGNLRALVTTTPAEVVEKGGADLSAVRAYLTAHPGSIQAAGPKPLEVARLKLEQSVAAYRRGDLEEARQGAITAYLEGFELIEASLDNVDGTLRTQTEREMMALRTLIAERKPIGLVAEHVTRINELLDRAEEKLGGNGISVGGAFASSVLILLREGLEAILVLAAIIAFVLKTGRRDALPYIHFGWMAAALAGVGTWFVANHLLEISGADRELTEGISALLAAVMLLYVGYWLHSKSYANAWQAFIREKVTAALSKRTLWAMAGVSFLAVYRELFEIILFYQALWAQSGGDEGRNAVLGGVAAAAVLLAVIGWAILKYSVRLPLGLFFAVTAGLLLFMAVVFVGHGVAALQEAGAAASTGVDFVTLPLLGIRPTFEGLFAQAMTIGLIVFGVLVSRRRA